MFANNVRVPRPFELRLLLQRQQHHRLLSNQLFAASWALTLAGSLQYES
jgi:hypothetical protein